MGTSEPGEGYWSLSALPEAVSDTAAGPAVTLEVDGETFELRSDGFSGTHYAWVSGPNPGYGFSASPTTGSTEEHRTSIRSFLAQIDPETGFIEDD